MKRSEKQPLLRPQPQPLWKPFLPEGTEAGIARIRFARGIAAHDPQLRLYAILDAESCVRRSLNLFETAAALALGGVRLLQYRDKLGSEAAYLHNAQRLRSLLPGETLLLLNDYPHLVNEAGADGVHVGQDDCAVSEAREAIGQDRILGISTHSAEEALAAHSTEADYIAIGPVFATSTKANAAPSVGLCGVQAARAVTAKPLVAIGGIGLGDARAVEMAGADSIAVVAALLPTTADPAAVTARAQDFLARLK